MFQAGPLIFRSCLIAVILLTTGPLLRADDPPTSTDGDKIVPVTIGGRTIPIHVRDESDPFKNVSNNNDDGKYNPERIFSTRSSMADKQFLPSSDLADQKSALNGADQNTFITKTYTGDPSTPTSPNLNTKVSLPTTSAFSSSATGFDKAFPISKTDVGQTRTAELASTSPDQDRTAYLGPQNTSAYASASDTADANKTFDGREAADLHHQLTKLDNGQMMVTDLPNRPLTIDEVRDLINHGFKPDTSVKPNPADQSKPLNSPDYKPQPLRDNPSPSNGDDDDKNDPVPPPGTMAAPENSEPLPQP